MDKAKVRFWFYREICEIDYDWLELEAMALKHRTCYPVLENDRIFEYTDLSFHNLKNIMEWCKFPFFYIDKSIFDDYEHLI